MAGKKGKRRDWLWKKTFLFHLPFTFCPFWPLPSSTRSTEVRYSTGYHSVIRFAVSHSWISQFFIPETKIFKANIKVKSGQVGAMPKIHFRLEMNWLTVLLFVNYLPSLHTERVIYMACDRSLASGQTKSSTEIVASIILVPHQWKILLRSFHWQSFTDLTSPNSNKWIELEKLCQHARGF